MRIRIVVTFPGKHAIQVVSKYHGKLIIHKHIGTFSNEIKKESLLGLAKAFIKQQTGQVGLFDVPIGPKLTNISISGNKPLFVYELLGRIYDKLGFSKYSDSLIRDLVIARIYSPSSKRETREVLEDLFNCKYSLKTIYRHLKKSLEKGLKDSFQHALISFAKDDLKDSLRLVFYDVTTLYFDSHARVGLKDFGFSKDHHSTDVQIVVGLVVNKLGFPLYFDVFNGKTFEGNTFVEVIEKIQKLLNNPKLVVVADAAMISQKNIDKLVERNIGFIVGARLSNLTVKLQSKISQRLSKQEGKIITTKYYKQRLICQYLKKRAAKDKFEREKQLSKAKQAILSPSRIVGRFRFLKANGEKYLINEELIAKAEKLEGIKGYLTNTSINKKNVISRYHDLWRIENDFRVTKSDLEARPIFLHLDETITGHLVTVFAGLAICRYLEIKTGMSIHKILKISGKVLTHKVTDKETNEIVYLETTIENEELRKEIELLKSLGY